jgi:hypothetical protein
MRKTIGLAVLIALLVGCGGSSGSGEQQARATPGAVALLKRPFSPSRDETSSSVRALGPRKAFAEDQVRLSRSVGPTRYYVGARGKVLCLILSRQNGFEATACGPRTRLRHDVIYLTQPDQQTMNVSGIASDAVSEVRLGEASDAPEANVFVINDVPLQRKLTIRFDDGTEKVIDLGDQTPP